MMNFIVWMLLGACGMVNGLEVCSQPVPIPVVREAFIRTARYYGDRLIGYAELEIALQSEFPLKASWWSQSLGRSSDEGLGEFAATQERAGDIYTFKLRATAVNNGYPCKETDTNKCIDVWFTVFIEGACQVVRLTMEWLAIRKLQIERSRLPTVLTVPMRRYYIDDNATHSLEVVLASVDNRKANESQTSYEIHCFPSYARIDGKIERVEYQGKSWLTTTSVTRMQVGNIGRVCNFSLPRNVESIALAMGINLDNAEDKYIQMSFLVELRRHNVQGAAVSVVAPGRVFRMRTGTMVLPTSKYDFEFFCIGEASRQPVVAAANGTDIMNGVLDLLQDTNMPNYPYTFYKIKKFEAESPHTDLDEDNYICSAGIGNDVSNQLFKVVRIEEIKLVERKRIDIDSFWPNNTLTVNCSANAGYPVPTIKFFGSRFDTWRNPTKSPMDFVEDNKEYEIKDSDLFDVRMTRINGITQGILTIRNINTTVSSDLKGFDYDRNSYTIFCVAFNLYDIATQEVVWWTMLGPLYSQR